MEDLWQEKKIALFGATGVVGKELLALLLEKKVPVENLFLFASRKKNLSLQGSSFFIDSIPSSLPKVDIAFLCAGSSISEKLWNAFEKTTYVIDLSSKFRMDPHTPLIIPEINLEEIQNHKKITSPNCVATLLCLALFPLHQKYTLKKVILSTYQAASGGGSLLMEKLLVQTKAFLQKKPLKDPYAFNVYPHESPMQENGYAEEEIKIQEETKKILKLPSLCISATSIRVPVFRSHSISVHAEFEKKPLLQEVRNLLQKAPGISFLQDNFPTPFYTDQKREVFCGRIRSPSPYSLEMWIVGDQLLKGAALNAVQIGETLINKESYVLEEKNG